MTERVCLTDQERAAVESFAGSSAWEDVELGFIGRPFRTVRERAELAEVALGVLVLEARAFGSSWAHIGELLGVTRQAAQQKYGPWIAARSDTGLPPALPGL